MANALPVLSVDFAVSTPVYRQIANALRGHLVDGRIGPGVLLPPVRQLALDLGVHFNTVAQAYRLLADEGWLDLRRRRGALVLDRDAPAEPDPRCIEDLMTRLRDLTTELRAAGMAPDQIALALRRLATGVER
jgi:DNA-binding transcriptional regulator YhcF (GntR family)